MSLRSRSPKQQQSSSNSGTTPSTLNKLGKFALSLYLLSAIFFTSYQFILLPSFNHLIGSNTNDISLSSPSFNLSTSQAQPSREEESESNKSKQAITKETLELLKIISQKHPALETAGVKAADIREEEESDLVWAAAEAADNNKGKGKAGGAGGMTYVEPKVLKSGSDLVRKRLYGLDGVEWNKDWMNWDTSSSSLSSSELESEPESGEEDGLLLRTSSTTSKTIISEDLFLSLSFSSSLQPSKVIPYYYRAKAPDRFDFSKEDITITTLVTGNRFTVFQRLVERYRGTSLFLLVPYYFAYSFLWFHNTRSNISNSSRN